MHRSFQINSRKSAEEIIKDLERRTLLNDRRKSGNGKRYESLRKLVSGYRSNPDAETESVLKLASEWRKRWNR